MAKFSLHLQKKIILQESLISIIVPIYNTEAYLERCLDSLQNQSYTHFEVLMVDDGSVDNSGQIMKAWAQKDDRFRSFSQENKGLSAARNVALDQIRGKFVAFVDSDDWLERDFLLEMIRSQMQFDAKIVYCNLQKVDQNNQIIQKLHQSTFSMPFALPKGDYQYFGELSWFACNKIFHHTLFEKIRFVEGIHFEDIATIPKLFLQTDRIAFTPGYLYHYFERTGSISRSYGVKGLDIFLALEEVKRAYQESNAKKDQENWKRYWILQGFYSFGAYMARVKNRKLRNEMLAKLSQGLRNEQINRSEIISYKRFGKSYLSGLSLVKRLYYWYIIYFKISF